MSFEHPSKLSFSIEESVWLNKGEEVEEVLGMSLEPEIVIEERDHHVYIRGGLRLLGEYRSTDNETIAEGGSLEQQVTFRSVKDVAVSSNGIGEIKHYFPIDVTIPSNRIQNLDDVFVQVESFDYDLPEPSCIQLTADIAISGMTYKHEERTEERVESVESTAPTAFSFEAKKEQSIQKQSEVRKEEQVERLEEVDLKQIDNEESDLLKDEEQEKQLVNEDHGKVEDNESEEVLVENQDEEKLDQNEEELVREEYNETQPELNVHFSSKEFDDIPLNESNEPSNQKDVIHHEQEVQEEKPREENALYLTKMLSKGEERFSKWKMCIIQENESLETIAQRYDISLSQLIRMNRLQGEQVEEGQILYIPVSVES
ncbi:stage VI sporulation protein D [Bacillus sp. JCM 19034]|uniref:stage VI sporulation protein D n=1 Tax=Bacillus sp. JCM 19034 TaxID=1481928 RepID=UPI000783BA8D|nr:stage VI sporulation protein D [Bacillus sp. JCM 19034]